MISRTLTFLRNLPIETIVIFVPCTLAFISVYTIDSLTNHWGLEIDPRSLLKGPLFGEGVMRQFSKILIIYGGLLLVKYFFYNDKNGSRGIKRALQDHNFFSVAGSTFFWFIISTASVFGISAITKVLFRSFSYFQMANASEMLMHWDKVLFSIHPALYLHTIGLAWWAQLTLVYTYLYLPILLSGLLIVLFCTQERLFRIVFLSLTLSIYFSLPFWIIFPAIPPYEMYTLNVFQKEQFSEVSRVELSNIKIKPLVVAAMNAIESMWIDEKGRSFSVSSFPSMHIIWATIILYALSKIRWWLGGIFIPFYVANYIGTMFLLEHYAVDTLLGVCVGIFTIYSANKLLEFEARYFTDKYRMLSIFPIMNIELQIKKLGKGF